MTEIPTYHRASIPSQFFLPKSTAGGNTMSFPRTVASSPAGPIMLWDVCSLLPETQKHESKPILACEQEQCGTASLFTTAPLVRNQGPCTTRLISEGCIYRITGIIGEENENRALTTNTTTYYEIPETLYDSKHTNNLLPEKIEIETDKNVLITAQAAYCQPVAKVQIQPTRYTDRASTFYNHVIIRPRFTNIPIPRQWIRCNFMGFVGIQPNEDMDLTRELMETYNLINTSSEATVRINTEDMVTKVEHPKAPLNKTNEFITMRPHKKRLTYDIELTPKQISLCRETNLYIQLKENFDKDLSEFCSYAYLDDQFKRFTYGTNHTITGKITGGLMGALYLDNVQEPTESCFVDFPFVRTINYSSIMVLTFACLYPPEDERAQKCTVCTCAATGNYVIDTNDFRIVLDHDAYNCYPNDSDRSNGGFSPYCVFQLPYSINCNTTVSSYVRYLPDEDGNMIDVMSKKCNVYTSVKIVQGCRLFLADYAVKQNLLQHVRLVLGNPKLDGNCLNDWSSVEVNSLCGVLDRNNIIFKLRNVTDDDSLLKTTTIFNDYSYLIGLSCSPTDFKIENEPVPEDSDSDDEEPERTVYKTAYPQECVHIELNKK